jgi:serine phosphatase RsbU (regulator of sigma subunit)
LPAREPRLLVDGHRIKICHLTLEYTASEPAGGKPPTILETISVLTTEGWSLAGSNSQERLRVVIEIVGQLVGVLDLDSVLEKVLEALFRVFPQTERGFIVFGDEESGELNIRASKFRSPGSARTAPSRTVYQLVTSAGQAILCEDVTADSRFAPSGSLWDSQVRTMICVPLWNHQRNAVGVLQLDTRNLGSRFTQDDLDFLVALASTISMAVENARLHQLAVLDELRKQEGRAAREVQRSLIPERPPTLAGYAFWHYYEPAHFVGGDYFNYHALGGPEASQPELPTRHWAIAVGDVSGKGMPAALLMARLSAEVRLLLQGNPDPRRVVERLNQSLCEPTGVEMFATLLLAVIDGGRHELTVVNAGHPPPIVRRTGGQTELIGETSSRLPLGVLADQTYPAAATPIAPGDVVVFYTDGVDAINPNGEVLGMAELRRTIAEAPAEASSVGAAIRDAVFRHAAGQHQQDDITILCFGRT